MLGLLLGIIGGPLGVLIGGTYGLLVGSLFDLDEAERTESVLSEISASVRPGHTALRAQVTEHSPEVVRRVEPPAITTGSAIGSGDSRGPVHAACRPVASVP
jgi:ABC-type lipoprotein release transport system permease subunit